MYAAAEPSDLGKHKEQRDGHGCLAIGISDRETESHQAWPPPITLPELQQGPEEAVAVSVGLQSALSANLTANTTETFFSLSKGCTLHPFPGSVEIQRGVH